MNWNLYLDDERYPKTDKNWTIARTVQQAQRLILKNGLPIEMSLDHDLGKRRLECIRFVEWLVYTKKYDLRNVIINIHSANPIGSANMRGLIDSWNKFLNSEDLNL